MESRPQHSIVVVIFPLLSLMKDQVNYLQSKVLKAAYIGEGQYEAIKKNIEKRKYQIMLAGNVIQPSISRKSTSNCCR